MALVCDVYSDFVTFPFGILGQVWYLIIRFLIFAVFLTFIPTLTINNIVTLTLPLFFVLKTLSFYIRSATECIQMHLIRTRFLHGSKQLEPWGRGSLIWVHVIFNIHCLRNINSWGKLTSQIFLERKPKKLFPPGKTAGWPVLSHGKKYLHQQA